MKHCLNLIDGGHVNSEEGIEYVPGVFHFASSLQTQEKLICNQFSLKLFSASWQLIFAVNSIHPSLSSLENMNWKNLYRYFCSFMNKTINLFFLILNKILLRMSKLNIFRIINNRNASYLLLLSQQFHAVWSNFV
jgi:hypothetical protein